MDDDNDNIFAKVDAFCKGNKVQELYKKAAAAVNLANVIDFDNSCGSDLESNLKTKASKRTTKKQNNVNNNVETPSGTHKKNNRKKKKSAAEINNVNQSCVSTSKDLLGTGNSSNTSLFPLSDLEQICNKTNSIRRNSNRSCKTRKTRKTCSNNSEESNLLNCQSKSKSRRKYVAEIAARSLVVDSIDLVSSPVIFPSSSTVINIDSDEETEVNNINDSLDEIDTRPIRVKINWENKITIFPLRKYQKFTEIFDHYAKLENIKKENIILNLDDKLITENDTPESINYEIYMFIYGRKVLDYTNPFLKQDNQDPDLIKIKIQWEGNKKPITMSLKKTEKFSVLYAKCAEELNLPSSKLQLLFDGDVLKRGNKPEDVDIEGGEVVDCKLKA